MRLSRLLVLLLSVAGLALAGAVAGAAPASADVVWLCKPGESPDPCVGDLTTTDETDGGRVSTPAVDPDPPADCFYVYPTVSEQPGLNADKSKDASVTAIARFQAQRYSQHCRMYAPVYRQRTLASISGTAASYDLSVQASNVAYGDVVEAFRQYLAQDNQGRPFVLIGHSQGSYVLRRLIREEVDGDAAVRGRMLSAILLGGNVVVKRGEDAGGDFQQVPACRSDTQLGCVVAWSTFDDVVPDPSRFGRVPATQDTLAPGSPVGPDYQVLCTNPADLAGNARRTVTSYQPGTPFPGTIGAGLTILYGGPQPTASTPWLRPADQYTAACEESNGADVLELQGVGDARHLNPSPDATWGLHLVDANIAQGQLVDLVASQERAYAARQVTKGPPACTVVTTGCPTGAGAGAPPVVPAPAQTPVRPTARIVVRSRSPRRFVVRTQIGARQGRPCDGRVRVSLYARGGRRLSRRTATIDPRLSSCRVDVALPVPRRASGRLVVRSAFLGGTLLQPATARAKGARVVR